MKKVNTFLILLALPLLLVSCLVDDEVDNSLAESNYIVGFSNSLAVESYFSDIGAVSAEYPLDLLGGMTGGASGSDITVSYVVDPSSTAVEGTEFDFVTTTGQLTIPAGNTFAMFPLMINTGSLNPTAPTELVIKLTSVTTANGVISSLNDTLYVTFVGCQSTVHTSSYSLVTTRNSDGAQMNHGTESITLTSVNNFKTDTTGTWAVGTIAPDQGFSFIDICGAITLPAQGLAQNYYSNQVTGVVSANTNGNHGIVHPNGDIEVNYQITFSAGDQTYTNYYTKL